MPKQDVDFQEAADLLAEEHWSFIQQCLLTHSVSEDVVDACKFHYLTAFVHGFKHGVEHAHANTTPEGQWVRLMQHKPSNKHG